ncbi:hypothetical protein FRC09_004698 [Ceratobasidium sp. 395]|nr:hypothetical protein FRC09_004698 [Ceratobasidium sp. 395]
MGLLDSLSRLSLSTDDIFTTANRTIADVGPFTDAVLSQHLITDIIRDAEEGEQTLFTHRTVDAAGVKRGVDVRPVPVPVSVVGGGVGRALGAAGLEKEVDVDVLLGAALRIVESYGSMPRAKGHIEQLHTRAAEVRTRISLLEDELEELKTTSAALPEEPEPSLKDEESSVVRFEAQLAAARRKRHALRDQLQSKKRARTLHNTGHTISTPTAAARTRTRPGAAAAAVNSKIPNPFLSHKPRSTTDPDATTNISAHLTTSAAESLVDEGPPNWADDSILSNTTHVGPEEQEEEDEAGAIPGDSIWEKEDEDDVGGEEATVVLAIPPAVEYSPPPSPKRAAPPLRTRSSAASIGVTEPSRAPAPVPTPTPAPVSAPVPVPAPAAAPVKPMVETKPKSAPEAERSVKITPEVEANAALVWSTVGKVIAPTSNYGADNPAPGAAETISILQSLASQSFANAPSSPSSASTLQNPAEPAPAQTILTAILLLYLLREGPSPLPAVRSALAEKEGDSAAGLGIKALYACVAKKLLKIDRKGREATVRFE